MPIETKKPLKECPYCHKSVAGLTSHVLLMHPSIAAQIEEKTDAQLPSVTTNGVTPHQAVQQLPTGNISGMVKEKLETMLNIKLIQMLERGVSVEEVHRILSPPPVANPNIGIKEIKEYHDLIYKIPQDDSSDDSKGWIDLATAALPIIGQMLPLRRQEENKNDEYRRDEEGSSKILKPIQLEAAGDTTKSGSLSSESGIISETEQ